MPRIERLSSLLSFPLAALLPLLLTGVLLWFFALPSAAQNTSPGTSADTPASPSDSKNFTLLGTYSGTTGFVGQAINASGAHAYVYFDSGLQVLDISSPAAVQHLGGRDTPQAGINAIERDGGLLYVSMDRPIGLGGDYLEILSNEPITKPKLLGTYKPPEVGGFPITSIHDLVYSQGSQLYVAQSDGVTVLDRFSIDGEGNIAVIGGYATDITRNLLLVGDLLVADTNSGVELLTAGSSPTLLGKLETTGPANAIGLVGNTLYRGTGGGLEIIDITKRANPVLLRTIPELRSIRAMESVGGLLYTAQLRNNGVRVYFASDPLNLIEAGHYQDDDFSAAGLDFWTRLYATGNNDGMRILQYSGETPRLQAQATGNGVSINGTPWGIGQTDTFTQPFTIRLAQAVASLNLEGKCEEVLRILIALQPISSESFDPFEVFVEVLDLSPTLCEPTRPQPVARSAASTVTEARMDLRLDSGGLTLNQGDFNLIQNVRTPVATAGSRGQNSFAVSHSATSGATTVRSFTGSVTVTPQGDGLNPVTLSAGQEVEVTASAVGEVKQVGGLFLPMVVR